MSSHHMVAALAGLALTCQAAYGELRSLPQRSVVMRPPSVVMHGPVPYETPYAILSAEGMIAQEAATLYKAGWLTVYLMSGEGTLKAAIGKAGIPLGALDMLFSMVYPAMLEQRIE